MKKPGSVWFRWCLGCGDRDILCRKIFVVSLGLVSLTSLSFLILSSSTALADASNTSLSSASVRVPLSCTFTSGDSSQSADVTSGQTTTIIGEPVRITCNDVSGYAIYVIGYSGDSYSGDYHTDMISALSNSYNIKTNGTSGASYWKMKLQDLSNATIASSYDSFQVIPSSFTKVASHTSNVTTGSFTPVYEVYVNTAQPADTYVGKVKYTIVHPNTMAAGTYSINYIANGGTGTMASESGLYNFEEHTLTTSTLTAPAGGYSFAGWCTVQDQTASGVIPANDPQTTCTGTSYTDGATIPPSPDTSATANGTLSLYAYWNPPVTFDMAFAAAGVSKYSGTGYHSMQSLTSSICGNVAKGQTTTLIDVRDGSTYTVAKLNDDNCWMTQNLALDLTTVSLANLKGNTNATDTTLEYLKGIYSRDVTNEPNGNYPTAGVSKAWTSGSQNYYSIPMIAVDSNTSGLCNDKYYCVNDPTSRQWNSNSVTQATINGMNSIAQGKIGVYYNYCAASAGSYCYGNGADYTGSPTTDPDPSTLRDVTEDICPTNWRLPTSGNGTNGEFKTLYTAYGNNTNFQTALSTPLAGFFYSGNARSQGNNGRFFSSTWSSTNKMLCLYVHSTGHGTEDPQQRDTGHLIRCIMSV